MIISLFFLSNHNNKMVYAIHNYGLCYTSMQYKVFQNPVKLLKLNNILHGLPKLNDMGQIIQA